MNVGQEDDGPAEQAGKAARDAVKNAEWPPTRADSENIGAAAGGAAAAASCAALGAEAAAPICQDIGELVGEYVGAAIYDFLDSFLGSQGERLTREAIQRFANEQSAQRAYKQAAERLVALRAELDPAWFADAGSRVFEGSSARYGLVYTVAEAQEGMALSRWGALTPPHGRVANMNEWLHRLTAAEAGRAAELIASRNAKAFFMGPPLRASSGVSPVVMIAGAAGIGWLLLRMIR